MSSQKYDWNKWFEKKRFVLIQGTHYMVNSGTMYQQIRNAASQRGLRVQIHGLVDPDSISVVVIGNTPVKAKPHREVRKLSRERARARELAAKKKTKTS